MNKHMKSFIAVLLAILLMPFTVWAQEDSEAALLLDLKKRPVPITKWPNRSMRTTRSCIMKKPFQPTISTVRKTSC